MCDSALVLRLLCDHIKIIGLGSFCAFILGCPEKNVVFGRRSLKIQKHLPNKYIFNQSKLHKIEYICANVGQCHRCLFYKSRQILSQERSGKLFLHLSEFPPLFLV